MENKEIFQLLVIAFFMATFLEIFNFYKNNYIWLLELISPGFGKFFGDVTMILFLVTICFLIGGYYPKLINLKNEELIKLFKIIAIVCFIAFVLYFLRGMYILAVKLGEINHLSG